MAKELILRPFTSELFRRKRIEILASLISIKARSPKSLEIICKGHSIRAANLLSELLLRNYHKLLAAETSTSPIPDSLIEKFQKYQSYEEQLGELKILIQKGIEGAPEESVEVMAIRSEIMQLDEEINRFKNYLLQIDEIHKKKSDPNEYLDIPPIRDFGQVSQIADILEQLKSMRLDDSLNPFTRDQVEKNILANSKELEKEVVTAIEKIKADVTGALAKRRNSNKLLSIISQNLVWLGQRIKIWQILIKLSKSPLKRKRNMKMPIFYGCRVSHLIPFIVHQSNFH